MHRGFLQRSWLTCRPLCTWLASRLFCGEQAGTVRGRCSWETAQASDGRPAGTPDNTVPIHLYVAASTTTLTASDTRHPVQPLLQIPKGQHRGNGDGLETLTLAKISDFTAQNALEILHSTPKYILILLWEILLWIVSGCVKWGWREFHFSFRNVKLLDYGWSSNSALSPVTQTRIQT